MDRDLERHLEILTAIGEGRPLTQRALSARLGIALGLTNLYLRRLVRKGYVKVVDFPRKPAAGKRLRYLLTPKGLLEKSRLTYDHMAYWASMYGRVRRTLREGLTPFLTRGLNRIALVGTGEPAELAYLTLREFGVEPVGVFDKSGGGRFLGFTVRDWRELVGADVDGIVLATFDRPDALMAELEAVGLDPSRFIPLRAPARPARRAGDGAR
jgi:DNA-binding MarR family transcriptional regulator